MTLYTESLERLLAESEALVLGRRYAEGEARAREVLARQPRNARGHYLLALSALMQERAAEALPHVESALRADRVNARYHYLAGLCLDALGRFDEAAASQRRALQLRPQLGEARAHLGVLHERAGRIADAAECYRHLAADEPRDEGAWSRLGYCERLLGRAQESAAALRRAIALRADSAPTHNELALTLMQAGRTPEAIDALRRAVAIDAGFLEAWRNLAKVLYLEYLEALQASQESAIGERREAVLAAFERTLELDPGDVEARYLRDSLRGERVPRPPDGYIEAFFDRFAAQFDRKLVGELRYEAPAKAAALLAPRLAGRRVRVLDLGCGTGLSGEAVRASASRLVGVDLSPRMLERARARGIYDELAHGEIGDYLARAERGSFDLALALDVFIYVGELERVVRACAQALAAGGMLAFTTEKLGEGDFALLQAGRYAHAEPYVLEVASRAGLTLLESRDLAIRTEASRPVAGQLYLFGKP